MVIHMKCDLFSEDLCSCANEWAVSNVYTEIHQLAILFHRSYNAK